MFKYSLIEMSNKQWKRHQLKSVFLTGKELKGKGLIVYSQVQYGKYLNKKRKHCISKGKKYIGKDQLFATVVVDTTLSQQQRRML